ncbi:hypothetical protein BGW36DRAFT_355585 [Talaromyces proteolyticus]|uniref:Uncharacterized protein n=1 Tax=Talaromyces proteolyticus TaxID=1131652 RepID=A0AAD4L0Y7_9EURO|nr:uncharacterized protein BGW36DRAFT_355585 [Talaromyces proteolyticus]KAH8704213.1 hypothetical protein BGW36DRAFT_355585 [Talaromyces proteolyticus]
MIQYIVHRLYEEDHISFGRLVSALSEERLLRPGQASENVAYQLVFILVGLATFFYTPSLTPKDGEFEITPSSEEKTQYVSRGLWAVKQIQIDAESEQSIGDVIKQFSGGKHLLLYSRWVEDDSQRPQNREDVLVKVTNVNYWTLRKFIGIKVIFVDSVWEHLAFEQRTKTLKLFQYPSFCLMLCVRNSKGTFLGRFFDNYFEDIIRERGFSPVNSHDFFRELVFTYRLIFGQSRDAYKAFRSDYENKLDEKDIDRDPLLYRLCGSDWSNECLYDELDAPHIRTVYSTMSDFPFFGQRLIELQEYVLSQSPDNFTTLWRDRRDITTFYTLWAALIFGITTTLLGIIQVGLQMAQLGATA